MHAAISVGCSVYGLEPEHSLHMEAVQLAHSMRVWCAGLPMLMGGVALENAVASNATLLAQRVALADVVVAHGSVLDEYGESSGVSWLVRP